MPPARSRPHDHPHRHQPAPAAGRPQPLQLWGARDSYAPLSGAHRFAALLPDTRLVVLEEAGHFAFEDEPRRAADEVAGFLAAHAG